MKVDFSYKIVNVNPEARCMDIIYTSEEHGTIQIGARMPFEDETIEAIVQMYNPVLHWLEKQKNVLPVEENTSGQSFLELILTEPDNTPPEAE